MFYKDNHVNTFHNTFRVYILFLVSWKPHYSIFEYFISFHLMNFLIFGLTENSSCSFSSPPEIQMRELSGLLP